MRFHGKSLVESIFGCKFGCRNQNIQKYEHQAEYYLHVGKQEEGRSTHCRECAYPYACQFCFQTN